MQQFGRGLRAAEGKSRLVVIDFVGNHRVFARRIVHLLSLRGDDSSWAGLRRWLESGTAELPPGCLLDVSLEAKALLRQLLPVGRAEAIEGYRAMRDELGRRPTMLELFNRGFLPATIRAQHNDWFTFVKAEGDLTDDEEAIFQEHGSWFSTVELTDLNRSFKIVVLQVVLDRGAFWEGMEIRSLADACRRYLIGTSNCDSTSNLTVKYLTTRLRRWKSGLPGGLNGRWTGGSSSNGDENGFGAMVNVSSLQLNVQWKTCERTYEVVGNLGRARMRLHLESPSVTDRRSSELAAFARRLFGCHKVKPAVAGRPF